MARKTKPLKNYEYDKRVKCYRTEREEVAYVDFEYKSKWRSFMIRFIHSTNTQFVLGCLLIMDLIVLFAQVFLDAHFPPCSAIKTNGQCVDPNDSNIVYLNYLQCTPHPSVVDNTLSAAYYVSVGILILFEVELFSLLVVLGIQFLRNCTYWFDVFIVTVSLVLELTLHDSDDAAAGSALIVARLWRLVRIAHGIFNTKRKQLVGHMVAGEELPMSLWEEEESVDDDEESVDDHANGSRRKSSHHHHNEPESPTTATSFRQDSQDDLEMNQTSAGEHDDHHHEEDQK